MSITFKPQPQKKFLTKNIKQSPQHQTPSQLFKDTLLYKQKLNGEEILYSSGSSKKSSLKRNVSIASFESGLVGAMFDAYSHHQAITLRPEDFWCAILVQFSLYVNARSETLRSKFVNYEGKKEVKVVVNVADFTKIDFDQCTKIMASMTDKLLVKSIHDLIVPSFSTTTDSDKTVFSALMLSVTQQYTRRVVACLCGFRKITLLGTVDDYRDLAVRVNSLREYDDGTGVLVKWIDMLADIVDHLIATASGTPDLEYWSRAINHKSGSGESFISGWMSVFCVFNYDGQWIGDTYQKCNDQTLTMTYERRWFGDSEPVVSEWPIIDTGQIRCGLVGIPIILRDLMTMKDHESMIVAGSFMYDYLRKSGQSIAPRFDLFVTLRNSEYSDFD